MATSVFSNRWLRDDAIGVMLQEADQRWLMVNDVPDPGLARAWLAAMTVFRFSDPLRRALYVSLRVHRGQLAWVMPANWIFNLAMMVEEDPESYPFCLSEREFDHYARTNFGDTVQNSEGIYHPPGFYVALGQDIATAVAPVGLGVVAAMLVPDGAALAVIGQAGTKAAVGLASSAVTSTLDHFMPGGSWDAAKKDRLWPAYEMDLKRRRLM